MQMVERTWLGEFTKGIIKTNPTSALICTGMMALAFMGFQGMIRME